MARGEGDREEAWPEEEPPLSGWFRAVRGSRSNVGAEGEELREEGTDGETTAEATWGLKEDSKSTVMSGQEDGEDAGG